MSWRRWSLRTRIVALSTTLMGAIGVFMLVFFPNRMVAQARRSAVERGTSIATVMATALAPAVEFDDPQNANEVLAALASAGAVQFGVVRRADGTVLAAWHGEARPAETLAGGTHISGDLLTLAEPISGRAGGAGKLEVGISLAGLDRIQREATRTVAIATAIVIVVGAVASVILGSLVVGPIRRLTTTAQRISRGELPPRIPLPEGGDEVAQMAESLSVMLDRLDQANQQLLKASRHAGMAEVATGVLHNVGNVLTSVNVAVELMHERTRELPVARIRRLADHLVPTDEGGVLAGDRLAAAQRYVQLLGDQLERGRDDTLRDVVALRGHLEHIKRVVAMQNAYARPGGVAESTGLRALIDEAIEIGCAGAAARRIELTVRVVDEVALIDRHRVLQIVVNLVSNARDAVLAVDGARRIAIRARVVDEAVQIRVSDTGCGIAPEDLERVFTAGFTTKPQGHGYGLHSSALAARQLGGELVVTSGGPGAGATFALTVPLGDPAEDPSGGGDAG